MNECTLKTSTSAKLPAFYAMASHWSTQLLPQWYCSNQWLYGGNQVITPPTSPFNALIGRDTFCPMFVNVGWVNGSVVLSAQIKGPAAFKVIQHLPAVIYFKSISEKGQKRRPCNGRDLFKTDKVTTFSYEFWFPFETASY